MPKKEVDHIFDLWNEFAEKYGLPKARKTTKIYRRMISTRLKEDVWKEPEKIFAAMTPLKAWHRGDNDRQWKMALEFLVRNELQGIRALRGDFRGVARREDTGMVFREEEG